MSRGTDSYSEVGGCVNQEGERHMHFTKVLGNPGPKDVHKCVENRKPFDTVSPESFISFWDEWGGQGIGAHTGNMKNDNSLASIRKGLASNSYVVPI